MLGPYFHTADRWDGEADKRFLMDWGRLQWRGKCECVLWIVLVTWLMSRGEGLVDSRTNDVFAVKLDFERPEMG